jgi:hypothetical protein
LWRAHTHENTIRLYACCGTHTLTFSAIGFKNRINGYDLFLFFFGGGGGVGRRRTNLWNKKRNDENQLQIKKAQKAKFLAIMFGDNP